MTRSIGVCTGLVAARNVGEKQVAKAMRGLDEHAARTDIARILELALCVRVGEAYFVLIPAV
jgi:hypothetical protein